MDNDARRAPWSGRWGLPLRVSTFYLLFALAWFLFSDRLLSLIVRDPHSLSVLQSVKGPVFVVVTALLLFVLIARSMARLERSAAVLLESERHYRSLVELSPYGLLLHDGEQVLFANRAAARILGLDSADRLAGRPVLDFVHPDSHETVREQIRTFQEGERSLPVLTAGFKRADGTPVDVEMSVAVLPYQDRQALQVVIRELTQGRRAEEGLRETEQQFRALAQSTRMGILIFQEQGFVYANPAAEAISGYTLEQLSQRPFWDSIHPDHRQMVHDLGIACLKSNAAPAQFEMQILTREGETRWVDCTLGRTLLGGRPAGVVTIFDITERKRAEKLRGAVRRIALAASGTRGLEEFFRTFHTVVERLMPTDNFHVALFEDSTALVSFPYFADERESRPEPHTLSRTLTDHALQRGEPLLLSARQIEELAERDEVEPPRFSVSSWIGVPLRIEDRTIGLLELQSYKEGVRFGEREKDALVFLSGQVAMVVERKRAEEALRESEERFRTLAENAAAGILIYQGERWRYANPAALTITGYTHEELLRLKFWDVVHPDFRELVKSRGLARQRGEKVPSHYEFKIVTKGGQSRWVDFTGGMIVYQGKPAGVIMAFDVTDRKEAEEAFLLQQTYFRQLFESSPEGIVMLDNEDRVLAVNRGFEEIFQFGKEELTGSRLNDHIVPEGDREKATLISQTVLSGEVVRTEATRRRKDGRLVPVSILGFPILLQGDQIGVYGIYQDITARRESDERLDKLAHFDPLTDLPNRYRMREILKEALASGKKAGQRLAVLFLDLDRFKEINDTVGHDVADRVLQSAAHRLRSRVRQRDTVARMGSDEFLIVLPELRDAREVEETLLQIRRAFSRPIQVGSQEFHLALSAGAALFPEDGDDLDTLLKNADIALERAKAEGGDGFQFFTAEMSTLATERFRMKGRLRKALERQEFTLYYQPIVEGRGGRVLATEALLRWKSPEEGIIGPGRFIGVAEETGLIVPINEWALEQACFQNVAWERQGLPALPTSVNISARLFHQRDLVADVQRVLRDTGLPASRLILEITETTAMGDVESSVPVLRRLADLGIRIAIDDFGMGYSSLLYLKRFPVHFLKIAQPFIQDLVGSQDDAALVQAIVTMAHGLGMQVIAEGVETPEQLFLLQTFGCDSLQGFLFSRPQPTEALLGILDGHQSLPFPSPPAFLP